MKTVLASIFSLAMVLSLSPLATGQSTSNSLDTQLVKAAWDGNAVLVRQLLAQGANIDFNDNDGVFTALHAAVIKSQAEVVKLLLEKGAKTEIQDLIGNTPLIWAAMLSNATEDNEVVKLLLAHGAKIDAKNKEGETALTVAEKAGDLKLAKLLREHQLHP
jgi:ankyrin repeat protein